MKLIKFMIVFLFLPSCNNLSRDKSKNYLSDEFSVDSVAVYFKGERIPGADPLTFKLLDKNHGKDTHSVFFCKTNIKIDFFSYKETEQIIRIDSVDLKSFLVLDNYYSKDKNKVFKMGVVLINVKDPLSFRVLGASHTADKERGYFEDKPIYGSNGDKLRMVSDNNYYCKDDKNVYYHQDAVKNADPVTFQIIQNNYFSDKSNVFYQGKVVKELDPKLAFVLPRNNQGDYITDRKYVFFGVEKIDGVDVESFTQMKTFYSKDKNNVYFKNTKVKDADLKTFESYDFTVNGVDAKDTIREYLYGEMAPQ